MYWWQVEVGSLSKSYFCIVKSWIVDINYSALVLGDYVMIFHALAWTIMILAKK